VTNALRLLNFDLIIGLHAVHSSWFKRTLARTKDALTSDEMVVMYKEFANGLQVNAILHKQSEIGKNLSEAVLNILKGIENTPNACIRIGSVLVLKTTDASTCLPVIYVKNLTIGEMHYLTKHPTLSLQPNNIIYELENTQINNKLLE
jgi:hypothetical protein